MASSDYDRPMAERPVDSTAPPHGATDRPAWMSPLGITLGVIFAVLLLMALLG